MLHVCVCVCVCVFFFFFNVAYFVLNDADLVDNKNTKRKKKKTRRPKKKKKRWWRSLDEQQRDAPQVALKKKRQGHIEAVLFLSSWSLSCLIRQQQEQRQLAHPQTHTYKKKKNRLPSRASQLQCTPHKCVAITPLNKTGKHKEGRCDSSEYCWKHLLSFLLFFFFFFSVF